MLLATGTDPEKLTEERENFKRQASFDHLRDQFKDYRDRNPMALRYRAVQALTLFVFFTAGKRAYKKGGLTFLFGGQALCPEYHWAMLGMKPENVKEEVQMAKEGMEYIKEAKEAKEKVDKAIELKDKVEDKMSEHQKKLWLRDRFASKKTRIYRIMHL